jgi:hypothetical protein
VKVASCDPDAAIQHEIEISLPSFANAGFNLHAQKFTLRFATQPFCRTHIMNIMGRHILRLVGISTVAIAIPQLASAFDSGSGATFKLAMGPTSAAQKNQNLQTTSDNPVTKCIPSEGTCPKPHHRSKR